MGVAEKKDSKKEALESAVFKKADREYFWFLANVDTVEGPFSNYQILQQLKTKRVSPFDFCWRHGFEEWRALVSVPDFLNEIDSKDYQNRKGVSYPEAAIPVQRNRRVSDVQAPQIKNLRVRLLRNKDKISFRAQDWLLAFLFSFVFFCLGAFLSYKILLRGSTLKFLKQNIDKDFRIYNSRFDGKALNPFDLKALMTAPGIRKSSLLLLTEERKLLFKGDPLLKNSEFSGLQKYFQYQDPVLGLSVLRLRELQGKRVSLSLKNLAYR